MKITIYELLGLIKDGKAPKKIKVYGDTFEKNEYQNDIKNIYFDEDGDTLFDDYTWDLNDEVKILDEEDEFIDIEEIKLTSDGDIKGYYNGETHHITTNIKDKEVYIKLLNQLIKNQKKIIERLSNEVYSKH